MALLTAIQAASRQNTHGELADRQSANSHVLIGTEMIPEKSQLERWPEWMDLKILQQYASVSERTLRDWIHRPVNPLPAKQVSHGKILVKRGQFDSWMEAFPYQPVESIDVNHITDEIIDQFRKAA